STTTSLIHAMVKAQSKGALLGGNIGESPLRFLKAAQKQKAPVVLELSNFQLSDLGTIKISPHIGVWTNLYPDHLNKYPSMQEYEADKMKIFQYQKAGDVAILNWDNEETKWIGQSLEKNGPKDRKVLWFSLKKKPQNGAYIKNGYFIFVEKGKEVKVCKISVTKLLGEHNLANTLAAICAARSFGVSWMAIKKAIGTFKGVPNRLELIKEIKGVKFYNDCTATSPQATMAALKSFSAGKIILITGGNSKGSPLQELAKLMAEKTKALIFMPGKVNEELCRQVVLNSRKNLIPIIDVEILKEAVKKSLVLAKKGDVVLLSPGLTWLPWQNEFERGEEFVKIVKKI
ncbi:MAG: UDP-N-acetylmuramoyl-L-alanine--D-glutamate ligase, partial [Candidatus Magasanikbacteria bacterium]|nr:UDP-N-acetylmuramoyl-L-alanine--D-glutamate ligase [Candidatus Magasanikbacteria bacterium]